MLFNSTGFAVFIAGVLSAYWLLPRRRQNHVLLVSSAIFYGLFDPRFLALLAISTVTDFTVGLALKSTTEELRRRWLLVTSLVVNVGILATFKYFDFFVSSATQMLETVGLEATVPTLRLAVPVGISFYTFQTLSYTIDVFRRDLEPSTGFVEFAAYVSYFPQLLAGPIERGSRLLPQLRAPRQPPDAAAVQSGLVLFLIGLVKKVVIADALAPLVNDVYDNAGDVGWPLLLFALYAFGLQVYGDFSGYSDMARGMSRLFGIELIRNFEQPFLARNVTDFWRRWHVSLSDWLHDYLYVPLGGNRRGEARTYVNLIVVMLVMGLWHGPDWSFVMLGLVNGVYLAVHRRIGRYRSRGARAAFSLRRDWLATITTGHLIALSFVFFRATEVGQAWDVIGGLVTARSESAFAPAFDLPSAVALLLILGLVALALDLGQDHHGDDTFLLVLPPGRQGVAYGAMVASIVVFSGPLPEPFVYFQF